MCVIVYKPGDKQVSKQTFRQCFERNADGAGFMYIKGDKVVTVKGLFTFSDFWKEYKRHNHGPAKDQPMTIHFRIGTHGLKNVSNCHPHVVAEDMAFVHNGILSDYSDNTKDVSDTVNFMELIVKPLYNKMGPDFLDNEPVRNLMCGAIGGSKMIFMSPKLSAIWILNAAKGEYQDGVWFSNMFWKAPKAVSYSYDAYYDKYYPQNPATTGDGAWRDRTPAPRTPPTAPLSLPPPAERTGAIGNILFTGTGVWLGNKFWTWDQYDKKFPNGNGPYEKHLLQLQKEKAKSVEAENRLKDSSERQQRFFEARRKSLDQDMEQSKIDAGMVGPNDLFPEMRCVACTNDLTQAEVLAAEGVCTTCLIDITGPAGRHWAD